MIKNITTTLVLFASMIILMMWQNYFIKSIFINKYNFVNKGTDIDQLEYFRTSSKIKNTSTIKPPLHIYKRKKITFANDMIIGSINLIGAKIDDLKLLKYKKNTNKCSEDFFLLFFIKLNDAYYSEFGWLSNDENIELPNNNSVWIADKNSFGPNESTTLSWVNSKGIKFFIIITLDEYYMFTVDQKVINLSNDNLKTYASISRVSDSVNKSEALMHEGGIGSFNKSLKEISFKDLNKSNTSFSDSSNNWFGFSDKYWLTAVIPYKSLTVAKFLSYNIGDKTRHQVGAIIDNGIYNFNFSRLHFFAGAKELKILDYYKRRYNIMFFDKAIDFGMLYPITKPMFIILNYIHSIINNFGITIIMFTILIKLLLSPLAYKSFNNVNKLKNISPSIRKLKKECGNNNIRFNKLLVELYKNKKINPVSGYLPILLQLPVSFALYKVFYVTLEMRYAKFYLWIQDLSTIDITNIFNIFDLISWNQPNFLCIGLLPVIMSLTLYLQQCINVKFSNSAQINFINFLPLFFLFILTSFPSGLILYWSCSNIIAIIQKFLITKISNVVKEKR